MTTRPAAAAQAAVLRRDVECMQRQCAATSRMQEILEALVQYELTAADDSSRLQDLASAANELRDMVHDMTRDYACDSLCQAVTEHAAWLADELNFIDSLIAELAVRGDEH
jgi:hypothetical protein